MFKLIVNGKNGREESDFKTLEQAERHFELYRAKGHFGKEEQVIEHEEIPALYERVIKTPAEEAVLDEEGNEISPAKEETFEDYIVKEAIPAWTEIIPSEFTWVIEDHSAEYEAARRKRETKKSDRLSRVEQFKVIDWSTVDSIAKLKAIVRALVKEAIKDDE